MDINVNDYRIFVSKRETQPAEMNFLSKAKKEIVCALVSCGCRGKTEFRHEFEAYLCDSHLMWAIRKNWSSYE